MTFRDNDHGYLSSMAHEIRTDIRGVCRELERIQQLTEYQSQRLPQPYQRRVDEVMSGPPTRISDKTFEIITGLVKMNEILLHKIHRLEDAVYGSRFETDPDVMPFSSVPNIRRKRLPGEEYEYQIGQAVRKAAGNIEQGQAVALGPDGKLRPATPAQETEQEPDVIKEAKRKLSE